MARVPEEATDTDRLSEGFVSHVAVDGHGAAGRLAVDEMLVESCDVLHDLAGVYEGQAPEAKAEHKLKHALLREHIVGPHSTLERTLLLPDDILDQGRHDALLEVLYSAPGCRIASDE